MANITAVPSREGPIRYDLGIHQHFNEHIEEGDDLEVLNLVVADLAQLGVAFLWINDLEKLLPHGIDSVVLIRVDRRPSSIEECNLRLYGFFGGGAGTQIPVGF